MCAMPLTFTRPQVARWLGWSVSFINTETDAGRIETVPRGKRRSIPAHEVARLAGVTIEELPKMWDAFQSEDHDGEAA